MANFIVRNIPNTITCLNLFSGCVASAMAFQHRYEEAIGFILLGAFFDFFDGMTARLLNVSGPLCSGSDRLFAVSGSVLPLMVIGLEYDYAIYCVLDSGLLGITVGKVQHRYTSDKYVYRIANTC